TTQALLSSLNRGRSDRPLPRPARPAGLRVVGAARCRSEAGAPSMTQTLRLTDLQLILLSTAALRDDGSLLPPPDSIGERTPVVDKAIKSLLRRGLAAEPDTSNVSDPLPTDRDRLVGVRITAAGRVAIGADQDDE